MAIRLTAAPKAIMVATSTMVEAIISVSIVSPAGSLHRSGDRSCDLPPMICGPTPTSGEPRSCPRRGKGLHDRVPPSCGFGFVHGKIGRDLLRTVCPIMAFKALFKAPALYCTGVFAPPWQGPCDSSAIRKIPTFLDQNSMNLFKRICRPWIWCFSAFPQDRGYPIIRPDPNSDSFPMNPVDLLSMIAVDNRNQSRLHPYAITLYEIVFHGNKLQE